jgi:hypothetical protein
MRFQSFLQEDNNDKLARWGDTFGEKHGIMPDGKGFHTLCVEHMTGNIDDPAAYCARVKDAYMGSTYWRGKDKSKKEVKADVKKHPNYPKSDRDKVEEGLRIVYDCRGCKDRKCTKRQKDGRPNDCPLKGNKNG